MEEKNIISKKIVVPVFTNNKNQLEKRDKKSHEFVVVTFHLANDYRELAHKLKTTQDNPNTLTSPIKMLYAFSCELYLKALIKFCDKEECIHGHELKTLFDNIHIEEIKKAIEDAYNNNFDKCEQMTNPSLHKIFPVGFESTLERFNTAFEFLRYENEYVELWKDSTFLPWFSDTLHMICEQQQLSSFNPYD